MVDVVVLHVLETGEETASSCGLLSLELAHDIFRHACNIFGGKLDGKVCVGGSNPDASDRKLGKGKTYAAFLGIADPVVGTKVIFQTGCLSGLCL